MIFINNVAVEKSITNDKSSDLNSVVDIYVNYKVLAASVY